LSKSLVIAWKGHAETGEISETKREELNKLKAKYNEV
jgi:hypothetical protein